MGDRFKSHSYQKMSRKRHFLAVFHVKVDSALTTKLETIVPDWLLYYLALNLHNLIS